MSRVNILGILADHTARRDLMVSVIIATQAREGVVTTREQAERAYDHVRTQSAVERTLDDVPSPVPNTPLLCHRARDGSTLSD